ncbi:DUF1499 domain-containing protein [Vibrio sp. RC27]
MKTPKLWSWLALIVSILFLIAAVYPLMSVRMGSMGFRDATGVLRSIIQVGLLGVLPFAVLVLLFALKRRSSVVLSVLAVVLIAIPLGTATLVVPKGMPLFAGESAGGPPPGAGRTPPLNDISTDTLNPPQYVAVVSMRPEKSNTLVYPENGPKLQAQLFPDIAPIKSTLSPADAFNRAVEVAEKLGWEVVHQDSASGTIEAIDSTLFFGFKDDVVIRVSGDEANSSIVDIRSHSRVGRGDQGKNAERVRTFISTY